MLHTDAQLRRQRALREGEEVLLAVVLVGAVVRRGLQAAGQVQVAVPLVQPAQRRPCDVHPRAREHAAQRSLDPLPEELARRVVLGAGEVGPAAVGLDAEGDGVELIAGEGVPEV